MKKIINIKEKICKKINIKGSINTKRNISIKEKKYLRVAIIFLIAMLIEIFVCNFSSLKIIFCDNKGKNVKFEDESSKIFVDSGIGVPGLNEKYRTFFLTLKLDKVDFNIERFNIVTKNVNKSCKAVVSLVKVTDPDDKNYNTEILCRKVVDLNKSPYINNVNVNLRENEDLYINIWTYNARVEIGKIIANKVGFNFNFIRLFVIFFTILFIYYVYTKKIYKVQYEKENKTQKINLYIFVIILAIIFIIFEYCEKVVYPEKSFFNDEELENKYRNEYIFDTMILQTKALLQGRLYLKEAPIDEKNVGNVYDPSILATIDIATIFDSAYYNGKLYQYFSILPVILVMLPIRLITGYYVTSNFVNIFMFAFLIVALFKLYKYCIDRYLSKISLFHFILGYLTILFGSFLLFTSRGLIYDLPLTTGILCIILSLLLFISINNNNKLFKIKTIFAGIFTGFVVISKPSLIVYYILIFYIGYKCIKKYLKSKKDIIKCALLYFIPISIIALLQMWYNYMRFDNPFEFGVLYQLTVADMNVHTSFSVIAIIKGIIRYLFALPVIDIYNFPFIRVLNNGKLYFMEMNEYEYQNSLIGIIYIPILWLILFKNKFKNSKNKSEKEIYNLINLSFVIAIFSMILVILKAGSSEAYITDVKLLLTFITVIFSLKLLEKYRDENKVDYEKFRDVLLILCIFSIIIGGLSGSATIDNIYNRSYHDINLYIKDIFEFWK